MYLNVIFIVLGLSAQVLGHGMLMDPPNRGSLWRFDSTSPRNYDDNGLFCGGRQVQWEVNGGRCGICGDDYRMPQPRPNENTGTFGLGKITKTYKSGSIIKANVLITANHKGWFLFSICKLEDPSKPEKEECFQNLKLADGNAVYTVPSSEVGYYEVLLQLPKGLTCEQCVLRWHYNAGNSWGMCPDGRGRIGCGPQETFKTCSDIRIL